MTENISSRFLKSGAGRARADLVTVIYPRIPHSWRLGLPSEDWGLGVIGVVVPAPPPHLPDDDPPKPQQCPRCFAITTVEDSGINYCERCRHLIFVDDELRILSPDLLPIRCPRCNLTLEDGYDSDCLASERLVCHGCGHVVDGKGGSSDGFQFGTPE